MPNDYLENKSKEYAKKVVDTLFQKDKKMLSTLTVSDLLEEEIYKLAETAYMQGYRDQYHDLNINGMINKNINRNGKTTWLFWLVLL